MIFPVFDRPRTLWEYCILTKYLIISTPLFIAYVTH